MIKNGFAALLIATGVGCMPAAATDVDLGSGLEPAPGDNPLTEANRFKKSGPWRIGVSLPGVGVSWVVQLLEETRHEATKFPQIAELVVLDAEWRPAKQVADLQDLAARNLDAIIVGPVTPQAVTAEIREISGKGIPVIVSNLAPEGDDFTTELLIGGEHFGRVGGEFIARTLGGRGNVWMFRGIAGNSEDEKRYNGAISAFEGTEIKVTAEVYGDWAYAKGKTLCENLLLSGAPVDAIWFSGGEMTKGCIEVFEEHGRPLVPMTGESNNGFLEVWKRTGVNAVAAVFPPSLGQATIKAAVALLEGERLHKSYIATPDPITENERDQLYRPDLNANYWFPSSLSEEKLQDLFKVRQ
ncbi:MAG: ABC transporter substrate-binding protein [Mesorhizobium sp.]|uniref:ABC transporter substrate-binding protein n=1 Tax=Mesorhizobium sp. TaxID=1871066 RepID=UPI000FE66A14|nr:ABC transporter substrate-binding protein [Mesorhizobium sp.]RWI54731.1 MAG: ABC transporter substrate-binding protein [Mesorhizobium sp.]